MEQGAVMCALHKVEDVLRTSPVMAFSTISVRKAYGMQVAPCDMLEGGKL